jgi:hypothetical protein
VSNGNIDLGITTQDLTQLKYEEYFQCYRQTPATEKYYTEHNSSIWQMFDEQSPKWIHDLSGKLPQDFTHHVVSSIMIPPGQTVPYHYDLHYMIKQKYGAGNTFRYLIFLEDWKRGHYFELEDEPMTKWRAGDWIKISSQVWHLAGNMGEEPFYSAQVTVK